MSLRGKTNRGNYLALLSSAGKLIVVGLKKFINNLPTAAQMGKRQQLLVFGPEQGILIIMAFS